MRRLAFVSLLLVLAGGLVLQADTVKLKNGRLIKGQMVRYGNGEFVILLENQERMIVLVDAVESIEFDAGGAPAATGGGMASEKVVVLDSSKDVVATGLQLRQGDKVRIRASGEMQFSDGRASGPKGLETTASWPFPGERYGVLVALVGDPNSSRYYVVGEDAEIAPRSDGELYLQINAPSLQGARGAYTARLQAPMGATASPSGKGPSESPPAQSAERQLRGEFTVPADKEWIDTGMDLVEGDTLRIVAEGTINYTASKTCGPTGGERDWMDLLRPLPVNDAGRGALIAKMGESGVVKAFVVGDSGKWDVERNGRLFLGINDDKYSDNRGSFKVRVRIIPKS